MVGLDPEGRRYRDQSVRGADARAYAPAKCSAAVTRACFRPRWSDALDEIFAEHRRPPEVRSSIKLQTVGGSEIELMIDREPARRRRRGELGTVLFFEDVSQIAKVERMEAWREVARRIAHEIKNPLTPIQLSAERLRRQLGPRDPTATPRWSTNAPAPSSARSRT